MWCNHDVVRRWLSSSLKRVAYRFPAVLVVLLVIGLMAQQVQAAPTAGTYVGLGPNNGNIYGKLDPSQTTETKHTGGTMKFQVASSSTIIPMFCTDLRNTVQNNDLYEYSGLLSNCKLVYLMRHYPPRLDTDPYPDGVAGSLTNKGEEMAARQSAVWHFSDGWIPRDTANKTSCQANYPSSAADRIACRAWEIINTINTIQEPCNVDNPVLKITPVTAVNPLGTDTGGNRYYQDYEVEVLQGSTPVAGKAVSLSIGAGEGSLDDLIDPLETFPTLSITVTTAANGKAMFRLYSPDSSVEVTSTITATAEGMKFPAGAVYINKTRSPGQKLILGEETTAPLSAEASALWVKGKIIILKFEDPNLNQVQDTGEPSLSGWTFKIKDPDGAITTVSTRFDGTISFPITKVGTYTITEILQIGWQNTTPLSQTVTVENIEGTYLISFGNVRLPVVILGKCEDLDGDGVCNYEDKNNNGKYDYGEPITEPRLEGWHLQLADASGATRPGYGGNTNSNGEWIVANDGSAGYLVAGNNYSSTETLKSGWQTSLSSLTIPILNLPPGPSGYWHPNYRPASIKACKWHDLNGDGQQDQNEPMLAGWKIYLAQNGMTTLEQVTSADGCVLFTNLRPGTYKLYEEERAGWTRTYPTELNEHLVTVYSGDEEVYLDIHEDWNLFGNTSTGSISGYKWLDADGNGMWGANESGVPGWTINLYKMSGGVYPANPTASTTTDSNGKYIFNGLEAGTYKVCEGMPAPGFGAYLQTFPLNNGCHEVTLDSTNSYHVGVQPGPLTATGVLLDGSTYQIDFKSLVNSTWTYTVKEISGKSLSHWNLILYTCATHVTDYAKPAGVTTIKESNYIKWELPDGFTSGDFWVTLDGSYPAGTINAAFKAGAQPDGVVEIFGPYCGSLPNFGNQSLSGLKVTKSVDWKGYTPDANQKFEICISGPGEPGTETCKDVSGFNLQTGSKDVLFDNLTPGNYKVYEKSSSPLPLSAWTIAGSDVVATVVSGQTAQKTITNTFKLGSLEVTKTVNWNGVTPDTTKEFEICIAGPSYPNGDCKKADYDGTVLSWTNLIPGSYTVSETNPGASWTVDISGSPAAVPANGGKATATVTNTHKRGSLEVTKTVNWNNITPDGSMAFIICIKGPSYPQGDCQTVSGFDQALGSKVVKWENLLPGTYSISETDPGPAWDVSANPYDVVVNAGAQASAGITNTRKVGGLTITKIVNWNGVSPDPLQSFIICVNPKQQSAPAGQMMNPGPGCKVFNLFTPAGAPGVYQQSLTWDDLVPGEYVITEPGVDTAIWTVVISQPTIVIVDNGSQQASVTNTRKLGSLKITKVVDWGEINPDTDEVFTICVTGPSIPDETAPGACQTTSPFPANGSQTLYWNNLIPGAYHFFEKKEDKTRYIWVTIYDPADGNLIVPADGGQASGTVLNITPNIPPTAVTLMYFKADQAGGMQVRLSWATATESNNLGFNLYRANVNDPSQKQLVAQVKSQVGNGSSGPYLYAVRDDVPAAGTWYYWLADVDDSSDENPNLAAAQVRVLALQFKIFLPGLMR